MHGGEGDGGDIEVGRGGQGKDVAGVWGGMITMCYSRLRRASFSSLAELDPMALSKVRMRRERTRV